MLGAIRPDISRRQLLPCPLVIAMVPLKCTSRNLQFPQGCSYRGENPLVPFPFQKMNHRGLGYTNIVVIIHLLWIHSNAYQTIKKEKHPFLKSNSPEHEEEKVEIPEQLLCPLCSNLMTDSVLIPCCGESFCDECKLRSLKGGWYTIDRYHGAAILKFPHWYQCNHSEAGRTK